MLRTARTTVALLTLVAAIATVAATPALAYWTSAGSASGAGSTGTLNPPTGVTVPAAAAPNVQVTWTAGTGGVAPAGYFVTRRTGATVVAACASSPTALISATSCSDMAVPDGAFTYTVAAVFRTWTAVSAQSANAVTVENAAEIVFVSDPTNILVANPITPEVTVAVQTVDHGAFMAAGIPVTLAIANNPAAGVLSGTLTVDTDSNGIATFDNISIDKAGIGYTLIASSSGLTGDTSVAFDVAAPPPPPLLGAAQSFSLLGVTAVVNTGTSPVSGDVGVSPVGTITGFAPGSIGGDFHLNDLAASAAQSARGNAYTNLQSRTADAEIVGDLGGRTLLAGVYHSTAALALTGTLTLNANGNPDAVFIFQSAAAFNVAADSYVILAGGAQAANVYWVALGAANTGADSSVAGTIIAEGAITLGARSILIGRALSGGTVTLADNTIRFTSDAPPTIAITGGATATTKIITPTIAGTSNATQGSPVTVSVAGQTLTTTIGATGTWSVTATTLIAGKYAVVARVRDAAGNGTAVSQSLTVEVNPATVNLVRAANFAVLGTAITNTGTTRVSGDVGVSPAGAVTGLAPTDVNGDIHTNDSVSAGAYNDLGAAFSNLSGRVKHTEIVGDLGGKTFHLGIHHQTAAMALTGTVTLDAENNQNAIFIFQADAAFNTAADSEVVLVNGADAANVYWVVTGAAGTGARSVMVGTILAAGAITLGADTELTGRALSSAIVTLADNTITRPGLVAVGGRAQVMEFTEGSDLAADEPETNTAPVGESLTVPADETTAPAVSTATSPPATATSSATSPVTSPSTTAPPQSAPTPPTTSGAVTSTPPETSSQLQTTAPTTTTTTTGSSTTAVPAP